MHGITWDKSGVVARFAYRDVLVIRFESMINKIMIRAVGPDFRWEDDVTRQSKLFSNVRLEYCWTAQDEMYASFIAYGRDSDGSDRHSYSTWQRDRWNDGVKQN